MGWATIQNIPVEDDPDHCVRISSPLDGLSVDTCAKHVADAII